jgi:hypothetical protein
LAVIGDDTPLSTAQHQKKTYENTRDVSYKVWILWEKKLFFPIVYDDFPISYGKKKTPSS